MLNDVQSVGTENKQTKARELLEDDGLGFSSGLGATGDYISPTAILTRKAEKWVGSL